MGVMRFADFVGILLLWGIFTVGIIAIRIVGVAVRQREERQKAAAAVVDDAAQEKAATLMQATIRRRQVMARKDNGQIFLDQTFGKQTSAVPGFNGQGAMLRHLVADVHGIKLMVMESLKRDLGVEGGNGKAHLALLSKMEA